MGRSRAGKGQATENSNSVAASSCQGSQAQGELMDCEPSLGVCCSVSTAHSALLGPAGAQKFV